MDGGRRGQMREIREMRCDVLVSVCLVRWVRRLVEAHRRLWAGVSCELPGLAADLMDLLLAAGSLEASPRHVSGLAAARQALSTFFSLTNNSNAIRTARRGAQKDGRFDGRIMEHF